MNRRYRILHKIKRRLTIFIILCMPVFNGGHALADGLSAVSTSESSMLENHKHIFDASEIHTENEHISQIHETSPDCCGAVCVAIQFTPEVTTFREKPPIFGSTVIGKASTFNCPLIRPPKNSLV